MVRKHVLPAGQINLVMCGSTAVINGADSFTKQLVEGDGGYKGKVLAYAAPLEIDETGSKWADPPDAATEEAKHWKVDITERLKGDPLVD